jgi:hypothetical protein
MAVKRLLIQSIGGSDKGNWGVVGDRWRSFEGYGSSST